MVRMRRFVRFLRVALPAVLMGHTGLTSAQAVCEDAGSTMLWQVEGEALDKRGVTVNLLGSIHVGKAEFYPLAPEIESRFHSADALVFEVDPQTLKDPQTALMIQQRGTLPAGQTLDEVVSADTLRALNSTLSMLGVPESLVANLRPWLVSLMLTSFQAEALGYNAQYGIETYLMQKKPAEVQVLQLESIEAQVAMMEALNAEVFLRYSLLDLAATNELMSQLIDAWRCGDHARLGEALFPGYEGTKSLTDIEKDQMDELMARIFSQRNVTMANGIERFIENGEGAYFVVVGAGHLIGEDSVVDLLQKRGYRVTPVRKDVQ